MCVGLPYCCKCARIGVRSHWSTRMYLDFLLSSEWGQRFAADSAGKKFVESISASGTSGVINCRVKLYTHLLL